MAVQLCMLFPIIRWRRKQAAARLLVVTLQDIKKPYTPDKMNFPESAEKEECFSTTSWMTALAIKVKKNKAHKDLESSKLSCASSILSFLVLFQSEEMVQSDWRDKDWMKKGTRLSGSEYQCGGDCCSKPLDDFWTEFVCQSDSSWQLTLDVSPQKWLRFLSNLAYGQSYQSKTWHIQNHDDIFSEAIFFFFFSMRIEVIFKPGLALPAPCSKHTHIN